LEDGELVQDNQKTESETKPEIGNNSSTPANQEIETGKTPPNHNYIHNNTQAEDKTGWGKVRVFSIAVSIQLISCECILTFFINYSKSVLY
jgi:hypothetical protein